MTRDLVDHALGAGGTADWISPLAGAARNAAWHKFGIRGYRISPLAGAARNAAVDGVTLSMWREDAPGAQAALQRAGIASWGWALAMAIGGGL